MRIDFLHIENFAGAVDITIEPKQPIIMVAGANEAGKSSAYEALGCALGAEPARVKLKKDYGQLVTDGAKKGLVSLKSGATGESSFKIPSGDRASTLGLAENEYMKHLLRPSLFATSDANARRSFLFRLMKVVNNESETREKLAQRGVQAHVIETLAPWLKGGFEYAASNCSEKATECRGAWRGVTGETYGKDKAASWKHSATKGVGKEEFAALVNARDAAKAAADAAQQEFGRLTGLATEAVGRDERLAALRKRAGTHATVSEALKAKESLVTQWQTYLEKQQAALKALKPVAPKPVPAAKDVTCSGCGLIGRVADGVLQPVAAPAPDPAQTDLDEAGMAKISAAEAAVKKGQDGLATAKAARDKVLAALHDAEEAAVQLQVIESAMGEVPTQEQIAAATECVSAATAKWGDAQVALSMATAANEAYCAGDKKQADAKRHHDEACAWVLAAELLSPSGIPDELLSAAIGPFNDRLREHCAIAGWPAVEVTPSMDVTLGGRVYGLCSRSAKWRVDSVCCAAIAEFSGIKWLAFDEYDLLGVHPECNRRSECLKWLHKLVSAGRIEQVWLFGTFKEKPFAGRQAPAGIEAVWVEKGRVVAPGLEGKP